ncbi:MAG: transcription antitermination factor NusB, partial [Pseudoclavibacter sp.]|nr:transcription antitermination factor NusB [Pseudoclavibacter sp.]
DARTVAWEVLQAVQREDAYANLLLPKRIERAGLRGPDAGLATELCYGTLRARERYDAILAIAAARPVGRIDGRAIDVLRLGCHQLLGMGLAPHAAVHETVGLARRVSPRAAGFVNAVLRRLAAEPAEQWNRRAEEGLAGQELLAVRHAHPAWIVQALGRALAAEGRGGQEELARLLTADNEPPRVALAAMPGLADREALLERHSELLEPGALSPIGLRLRGGDPARVPEVAAGLLRVQDEGSQLVALALSEAEPVRPGERWLDMCAGPGGKAALLAAVARRSGARLLANEAVPARAGLVRSALAPIDPEVRVRTGDGRSIQPPPGGFHRILLDAPCTGLGALRRRPEARWRKRPQDLPALTALQGELLEAALAALAPGGLLAYVTCSPHPAETTEVVERAVRAGAVPLDTAGILRRIAPAAEAPGLRPLGTGSAAQLWPHRHGCDAMFLALLRRPAG